MVGPALRSALTGDAERWLTALLGDAGPGVALAGVGSLGRAELAPGSDLDVVLVHEGREDIAALAEALWYPIWDAGVALDHSVRTPAEAVALGRTDLKTALGLLDIRHIAGDAELTAALRTAHLAQWRADAPRRLPELAAEFRARLDRAGELAFLLEPDLKEARGGLRDVQLLWQVAASQRADRPGPAVDAARSLLLDVRGELHKRRGTDRLTLQEQDRVAAELSYPDADALMAAVSAAARSIAFEVGETFRRVIPAADPGRRGIFGRRGAARVPLAEGVVVRNGEVVLAQNAAVAADPVLGLRVLAAAARAGLPVPVSTWDRVRSAPPMPQPWPAPALAAFVDTLSAGPAAVPVIESFDQAGLLVPLLPEWEHTRSRPQRNAYHRFTVDRHLLEAAAQAAQLTRRVARPDLLLLGALLHDIGKGLPGDHTEIGVELVEQIAPRMGLAPTDAATLVTLVRHHLLLADVAQRRDLDDPATITAVADAVGSRENLDLLAALTEADALATGPAAWSSWKQRLLRILTARVTAVLAGEPPPVTELDARQRAMLAAGELAIDVQGEQIDVVCRDRPGVLAVVSGVLALHRLEIRSLTSLSQQDNALLSALAHPRYGSGPDWSVVRTDLEHYLEEPAGLTAMVGLRAEAYPMPPHAQPASVRWIEDGVTELVLEVRAPDGLGVLHRIAAAITRAGGGVHSARCQTIGADVVDSFTVRLLGDATRDQVGGAVLAALG
ncbi:MAG TPA: [protein-PII] uridylyltransferase [Mycobacteriales bacterium]|nr:[protein-PII] uridylyltransferase [Mycobacteriales bacterium]